MGRVCMYVTLFVCGLFVVCNGYVQQTFEYTFDTLASTVEWVTQAELCPYSGSILNTVQHNLNKHIKAQDEGVEIILNAISAWEFGRKSGDQAPLVLAFTGRTAVGKSETAFRIAEGALTKRSLIPKTDKYRPTGFLELRGEDYTTGDLAKIHDTIRTKVAEHLQTCGGNAVIVFDEVQKVLPGTLEALMPALEARGSIDYTPPASSFSLWSPVPVKLSTVNVIFVFITDMGSFALTDLMLSWENGRDIPQPLLRSAVKSRLDAEWQRLRFGARISEVVAFFPMEEEGIREVLQSKLRTMAVSSRGKWWAELQVDEGVVMHMSDSTMVYYDVNRTTSGTTKRFAKWGANAVMKGSLRDLQNLLHRHATPPRPDHILHVGLHSESNRPLRNAKWGTQEKAGKITSGSPKQLFLQWCKADDALRVCLPCSQPAEVCAVTSSSLQCAEGASMYFVDDATAFSDRCDTIKYGLSLV